MAKILLILIISVAHWIPKSLAADYSWIERDWISDAALSVDANPETKLLEPDALARFKGIFGSTVWRFRDGVFTGIQLANGAQGSSPYSARPIDEKHFEIIYYTEGHESILKMWRVKGGFCAERQPAWVDEHRVWTESTIIECYAPYDA